MELRPYQSQAVEAVYDFLRTRDDNPCIVIPTAGGKTPVMAAICRDAVQLWSGRVLILAHVRELLEQAAEKLSIVAPDLPVGIFSAGMKRRDLGYAVTIAGIQSVYERACNVGHVDLAIVDEAHLIPPDGEGMYRTFLADVRKINPLLRIIGMTATPFRMKSGTICAPENILNEVCFQISVRELIVQGYLCPLRTKAGTLKPDTGKLPVRGGEYVAGEVENLMDDENLVRSACREIVEHTQDRRSVLIFASGVRHGQHICHVMAERNKVECGFVCGETLPFGRNDLVRRFREGKLKYLCNVNVLTTGFDAPNIDCVALVRPTLSPGLYYQMVGRGFRLHPGKTDCLVLDFGENVLRHGPVDQLHASPNNGHGNGEAPAKECPQCREIIAAGYATCPQCEHVFPPRQRQRHAPTASSDGILSDQTTKAKHEVTEVFYNVHLKSGAPPDAPRTMRVDYRIGFNEYVSEWVCFEHTGYPRHRAAQWWSRRSNEPVPTSADEAVELADGGALAPTLAILVEHKAGEHFDRVVAYRLGDKPPRLESEEDLPEYVATASDDEVPF
ncbi:MAG: DEAD/DEAH box helicase family protein [Phycisphaerales bacterium]|nr:MAG: DEAD/DEAH box helicase family protein [Phycisphaerales bacterium]